MEVFSALVKAFAVGGAICVVGQLIIDHTSVTPARMLVGYVVTGVALGALGVYRPIADFAGCGATVPLTGFGFGMVEGVKKAVDSQGLFGALTGPLSSASGGIAAAVIFGIILSVIAKPKEKG